MNKSWYLPTPSNRLRVVLGCTGSVATIKVPQLARKLKEQGCDVVIVPTAAACHFLVSQAKVENKDRAVTNTSVKVSDNHTKEKISSDSYKTNGINNETLNDKCVKKFKPDIESIICTDNELVSNYTNDVSEGKSSDCSKSIGSELSELYSDLQFVVDHDEWTSWQERGDPVVHIELRKWAQIMLIAPLDANTLAKLACGLCDNLITCIVRAWDPTRPVLFCPAMNTFMYQHPFTAKHIAVLKELGMIEVPVVCKQLVCGDTGPGAMAEVATIVEAVKEIATICRNIDTKQ